jgi:hypothetical protein
MTRKVGDDDAVGPYQVGDRPRPDPGEVALAVQEHDGRPVTALEHLGRHAGELQPPRAQGAGPQQLLPRLPGSAP